MKRVSGGSAFFTFILIAISDPGQGCFLRPSADEGGVIASERKADDRLSSNSSKKSEKEGAKALVKGKFRRDEKEKRGNWYKVKVCRISDLLDDPPSIVRSSCMEFPLSEEGDFMFALSPDFYNIVFLKEGIEVAWIDALLSIANSEYYIEMEEGKRVSIHDLDRVVFASNIRDTSRGCRRDDREGCDIGAIEIKEKKVEWLLMNDWTEWFPALSPSGEILAWTEVEGWKRGGEGVFLKTMKGEKIHVSKGRFPAWSTSGDILLFQYGKGWGASGGIRSVRVVHEEGRVKLGDYRTLHGAFMEGHDPFLCGEETVVYHRVERGKGAMVYRLRKGQVRRLTTTGDHMGHATCISNGKKVLFSGGRGVLNCPYSIYMTGIDDDEKSCYELQEFVDSSRFREWWNERGYSCKEGDTLHLAFPTPCGDDETILFVPFCSTRGGKGRRKADYNSRLIMRGAGDRFTDISEIIERADGREPGRGDFFASDCYNILYKAWQFREATGTIPDWRGIPFLKQKE